MGLFSFTKDTNQSSLDWNELTHLKQLDRLSEESFRNPVAIFKHSTRCGISRMSLKTFESEMPQLESDISLYFLDLLSHRDISSAIAQKFGITHESPQIILIRNGKAIFHESHSGIAAGDLVEASKKEN
ncbi:bacillithiol system redox-active protein YtxJ [Flavobacterium silvaticum]|uniref:Bacillithiol system redox-active protein YtxJ n=1 Tax=Flavobacterium silvaticum TaxID=1852020 RepID=A0A972FP86_9FLAO|nr:bacillithiol system redox-active protein YtxJ [Flavobacterium silvaticum]NMH28885.1 bacillithiol system redox-active protein YtxJ [Flavobacterium silvaticum]